VDVNFQYDALGRRVARLGSSGSFVFVQHDQQTIADYGYGDAPGSPLYRYVYASYIDEPVVRKAAGTSGTIHYYHRNQQYSITAMTTSTGAVAERYAYTAYGQPTILNASGTVLTSSAVGNRYTYTGREWDETLGLHHFRARWMSPLAGRFLGRDPMRYVPGMNLYGSYLSQDRVDPSGLWSIPPTRSKMFLLIFGPQPHLEVLTPNRIDMPPLTDLPAVTLPLIPLGPIDPLPHFPVYPPIIPPGTLDPPPRLTCIQFLQQLYSNPNLPSSISEELKCNPNIFCAKRCQKGDGPGNSAFPYEGRCHVCLNTNQDRSHFDWMGLLIHELTHCNQFRRPEIRLCGCPRTPHKGPNPEPPSLNGSNYETCKKMETEAYTEQCKYLFPNNPTLQQKCIDAGVCKSCMHIKGAPQDCPPWPDQPFNL
jgi:RHS repeat-associated protein